MWDYVKEVSVPWFISSYLFIQKSQNKRQANIIVVETSLALSVRPMNLQKNSKYFT